jgi:hypothetical protein
MPNESEDVLWRMPQPSIGDAVLYAPDVNSMNRAVLGLIISPPGDSAVTLAVLSPSGMMIRSGVKHIDDPGWKQENFWKDLGVWDFAPVTKSIRALMEKEKVRNGRETGTK